MGGLCTVATRMPDGRAYCRRFHTGELVDAIKNPLFVARDPTHLLTFKPQHDIGQYGGERYGRAADLSPAEYGIIVIDFPAATMLDSNQYTDLNAFSTLDFVFRKEEFDSCAEVGLLRRRDQIVDPTDNVWWYEETEALSGEQARFQGDQFHAMQRRNHCWLNPMGQRVTTDFRIDFQMTYMKLKSEEILVHPVALAFPKRTQDGLNPA